MTRRTAAPRVRKRQMHERHALGTPPVSFPLRDPECKAVTGCEARSARKIAQKNGIPICKPAESKFAFIVTAEWIAGLERAAVAPPPSSGEVANDSAPDAATPVTCDDVLRTLGLRRRSA